MKHFKGKYQKGIKTILPCTRLSGMAFTTQCNGKVASKQEMHVNKNNNNNNKERLHLVHREEK